jgi:hypothetical protein
VQFHARTQSRKTTTSGIHGCSPPPVLPILRSANINAARGQGVTDKQNLQITKHHSTAEGFSVLAIMNCCLNLALHLRQLGVLMLHPRLPAVIGWSKQTYPGRSWTSKKLHAQVTGKVVAILLQQMVCIPLVVGSHLLHQLLHLCWRKVCLSHVNAFTKVDCSAIKSVNRGTR